MCITYLPFDLIVTFLVFFIKYNLCIPMSDSILVVVPTLDSYKLLPSLVDSLKAQTFSDWRLLFIDGPSSLAHRNWLSECCSLDSRCSWILQNTDEPGIFGAMNQGFAFAAHESIEWLLFWGSDDWAASPYVFEDILNQIYFSKFDILCPDLVICSGRYVNIESSSLKRLSQFNPQGVLDATSYRLALFLGSTPPHQATMFGLGSRQILSYYSLDFRLSADLDYFLKLSRFPDLSVLSLDLDIVRMGDAGISGLQTAKRLKEVFIAYLHSFGWAWWLPFSMRYFRRCLTVLQTF